VNIHNNFISLEGIDNVGKSTAADKIKQYLEGLGHNIVVAPDPPIVKPWASFKPTLLGDDDIKELSRATLYLAARLDSIARVINPALEKNVFVVADRYIDSWFAYQITSFEKLMNRDKAYRLLHKIHEPFVSAGLIPEPCRTFLIIGDVKEIAKRGKDKPNSVYDNSEKQAKIQANYIWLSEKDGERIRVINGKNRTLDEIVEEICKDSVIAFLKK
jgi:dTMP kinase